jgi:16S rRNA G966 N2-methylase RsmD
MGNNYTVKSKYYGGYPASYLKRVKALFPDKKRVLHIFSGKVDVEIMPGDTVDINESLNPTFLDDAQTLKNVPLENYDLILCDPPYSVEDSMRYGTPMISRNKVMRALARVNAGTHIVWLDQALPMYRKDQFRTVFEVGMTKSTNHRYRQVIIFEKVGAQSENAEIKQRKKKTSGGPDLFEEMEA